MTLANWITLFRICLIPVFCALIFAYDPARDHLRWIALAVFVTAAVSDFIDGYIARRFNQATTLGARLDPLADKLLLNLGFVFIAANPAFAVQMPLWLPVAVLGRDVIIVMGAYLINHYYGKVRIRAEISGKIATAALMATLIAFLLQWTIAYAMIWVALAALIVSLADYVRIGLAQLPRHRSA